jgi:ketosteroid isomerase-like protein
MSQELLEKVVQALNRADLEPLHRAISDDIVWKSASTMKGLFRFGGRYRGRKGVEEVLSEIEEDYILRTMIPRDIVSSGDVTWGLFWTDMIYKPTLAQVSFDCAIRWRLKSGKVIEHQAFIDTAAMLVREQNGLLVGSQTETNNFRPGPR